ncbi:hypothetical protein HPB49_025077 [Dermacentor silvarum]|uniref:Uncharacterized protein n=1 Tax=Dermacentor silvarum TaxID=543639 RepID=A0ACB8CCA7_DERSI|nr:hypothetical protein HPB49_025077 [Dermacentor silvarum]
MPRGPIDDAFEDLEERYYSSRSSGDENDGFGGAAAYCEQHDDRPCVQALILFTAITCLTIVLVVIFVDAADVTEPPLNTSYNHGGSSSTAPGASGPPSRATGPWLVGQLGTLPRHRARYSATRLLPSHAWRDDLALTTRQACSLNRTLRSIRMVGLAFLNVRMSADRVPALSETLAAVAWANPGMFLALDASFEQLADARAPRLVPAWLLNQLVTLSLFVLDTRLPPPGGVCTAGFSMDHQRSYYAGGGERDQRRAADVRRRPRIPGAVGVVLRRPESPCVLRVPTGWRDRVTRARQRVAGCPACETMSRPWRYGSRADGSFFSYEFAVHLCAKAAVAAAVAPLQTVLQSLLFSGISTCLAVYAIDVDASLGLCDMHQERPTRLVYRAHEILAALRANSSGNSSDDSLGL